MDHLNEQIFGNELILSKIFSSLTLKQLLINCYSVNKLFNRIAKRIVTNRTQIEHIFELFRIGKQHNNSNNNNQNNREIHLREGIELSFISDSFELLEEKLKNAILPQLYCFPQLIITFYGNFCPHSKRPDKLMQYNCLRKHLSQDIQFLNVISSAGLIGSPIGFTQIAGPVSSSSTSRPMLDPIESQAHVGNCAGISMIIFPKYPNVEIDVFDDRNLLPLEKLNSRNDLKCLLVFSTTCTHGKRDDFKEFNCINQLLQKYDNKIAIGGIVIDETNYFSNNNSTTRKKSRDFYGIAFSGPKVMASSLVIKTERQELTERVLRDFKKNLGFDADIESGETIAFTFICTGRGIHTYETSNVESIIFRKVFPNVKLFGVFGHGEYGHNYWPSIGKQKQTKMSKDLEEQNSTHFWHFYTTVLVIIHLPKK